MVSGTCADGATNVLCCEAKGFKTISFRWKCSCEDDPDYNDWDYLCFLVDGVEKARIDGNTGWQEVSIDLLSAGTYVLSWEYRKDSSLSSGEDCAWLDAVSISELCTTNSSVAVPFEWLYAHYGNEVVTKSEFERKAHAKGENGLFIWQSYVAGLDPTDKNSTFRVNIEMVDGKPVVKWLPDLNANGTRKEREYRVLGTQVLGTSVQWDDLTGCDDPGAEGYRFFKVSVQMP